MRTPAFDTTKFYLPPSCPAVESPLCDDDPLLVKDASTCLARSRPQLRRHPTVLHTSKAIAKKTLLVVMPFAVASAAAAAMLPRTSAPDATADHDLSPSCNGNRRGVAATRLRPQRQHLEGPSKPNLCGEARCVPHIATKAAPRDMLARGEHFGGCRWKDMIRWPQAGRTRKRTGKGEQGIPHVRVCHRVAAWTWPCCATRPRGAAD